MKKTVNHELNIIVELAHISKLASKLDYEAKKLAKCVHRLDAATDGKPAHETTLAVRTFTNAWVELQKEFDVRKALLDNVFLAVRESKNTLS